jgi:hypothetical protein
MNKEDQTAMNKSKVKSAIKLAAQLVQDPQKTLRAKKNYCLVCWYMPRIVMHAFTAVDCESCKAKVTFVNSFTDKFCMPCAREHQLCAHCGGEVEL